MVRPATNPTAGMRNASRIAPLIDATASIIVHTTSERLTMARSRTRVYGATRWILVTASRQSSGSRVVGVSEPLPFRANQSANFGGSRSYAGGWTFVADNQREHDEKSSRAAGDPPRRHGKMARPDHSISDSATMPSNPLLHGSRRDPKSTPKFSPYREISGAVTSRRARDPSQFAVPQSAGDMRSQSLGTARSGGRYVRSHTRPRDR